MSVQLRAIQARPAGTSQVERARSRDRDGRKDFAALLGQQETAATAGAGRNGTSVASSAAGASDSVVHRRPGTASTPRVPLADASGRSLPTGPTSETNPGTPGRNPATAGNEVTSRGTLSDNPRTAGMYIPPDFYHGTSYSPVFDQQDASGHWVPTPRFAGQVVYGPWRGSLPDDFDPNARVVHDPLMKQQGHYWWKQDENGNWVKRETGYGGIPLNDDGKPMFTPDPVRFPEYFVGSDEDESA
ncbi:MAG: hypothetical protein FJ148_09515 [Deltaproteobacteria bacterium]|nr:hypothetical protein [Deltaproteobacteria bacterium]